MKKRKYIAPGVRRSISLEMEQAILAGSVVDSLNQGGVDTVGQAVESSNFDDGTSFNHQWE